MAKKLFFYLVFAGCLVACAIPTLPAQKVWTVANAGWICFREYDLSTRELDGAFRPKGCFSSTCTRRQEEKVDVELDGSNKTLNFQTKIVVLDTATHTPLEQPCSADCNSDEVAFRFADVLTGTYTVMLGDQEMGSLKVRQPSIKLKEFVLATGSITGALYLIRSKRLS